MKKKLALLLDKIWYKDQFIGTWLMPLGFIYRDVIKFRQFLYKIGFYKKNRLSVPVIVVGNITVGGTGKTPLVIWLAKLLQAEGYKPGIISRGYGGESGQWPAMVDSNSLVSQVGDEAIIIAKHSGCSMAVGPDRVNSATLLIKQENCDIIVSDDGLQHFALNRDLEIVVVDGDRWFGNGYCLPAGPLREPQEKISQVDFVVVNGAKTDTSHFEMTMAGGTAVNLVTQEVKPLEAFAGQNCVAVAGIGNPDRFFKLLANAGIASSNHPFPDHYAFQTADLSFNASQVLMTEKDAVKCTAFAQNYHWYVPVEAKLETGFAEQFLQLLREKTHG